MIEITNHPENIKQFKFKGDAYEIELLNIGASIFKVKTPDKHGEWEDILLGHKTPEDYLINKTYQGVMVGRNAGRIENGKFTLNNKEYTLPLNDGTNNLHSSGKGISHKIWNHEIKDNQITFSIVSKEKDDMFPGDVEIKVCYKFKEKGFSIQIDAKSNKDTICNITNHSYWNLCGGFKESCLKQDISNSFEGMWELNDKNIPTKFKPLNYKPMSLSKIIDENSNVFSKQRGFDHPFKLKDNKSFDLAHESGRTMIIRTSYPYVVLYSQNWEEQELDNKLNLALAIECQYIPNDINLNKDKSKTILKANIPHSEFVEYQFNQTLERRSLI